ncbi:MAG: Yip1 family protein, partial [Candidatus Helarchaeota archaeon]
YEIEEFIQRLENLPILMPLSNILFIILIVILICGIFLEYHWRNKQKTPTSSYYNIFCKYLNFQKILLIPHKYLKSLNDEKVKFISFSPIIILIPLISLSICIFNYFGSALLLFLFTTFIILILWFYFSGIFYILGRLLKGNSSFLKTLEFTQYIFIPFYIVSLASLIIYGIFTPEFQWYYIMMALIDQNILIWIVIIIMILFIWSFIIGIISIIKNFKLSFWKALIISIIPIIGLIIIIYFIFDLYTADLIVYLNEIFKIITSVFNRTQTSASQFF